MSLDINTYVTHKTLEKLLNLLRTWFPHLKIEKAELDFLRSLPVINSMIPMVISDSCLDNIHWSQFPMVSGSLSSCLIPTEPEEGSIHFQSGLEE